MMNLRRLLMISSLVLLLSGCAWFRPFHSTALDALTESPGELFNPDFYIPDSIIVLQQQAIASGQVLLYRWQSSASQEAGTYCLAATFVTPEGNGWRAQSTGFVTNEYPRQPPLFGCEIATDAFTPAYFVGGNITPLTTAYGLGPRGQTVRILWSDGQIDTVPLKDGAFLLACPETLVVQRIELLDSEGRRLDGEEW